MRRRVFLLKDGMMLSRSDVDLPVRKSPVQRLIHRAAQDYGLLYGIAAALIALLAGWRAAVVFNRRWRPCRLRTTSARCRRPPAG
ncbi:TIGR02186 family protein [uncultured Salipiger sp.]|uniref:TIGR02186 family protein n=1 Tax=uncultured Salipiger sp. TaxID=499810 RepID=UPI00338FBEFE